MKREDFDIFYKEVISPCIDGIKENAESIFQNVSCIDVKKNAADKIFSNYQKKRDYVRCNYMSKLGTVALDRHKVASCMVYAVLKANPLKIDRMIPGLPENIMLANEYLAFFVALNIIEMYKLDEFEYKEEYEIILPRTSHEEVQQENTYESNICRNFYYIKLENIEKYDVLSFANVFFLLEKYTDTYMRMRKAEEELDQMRNK